MALVLLAGIEMRRFARRRPRLAEVFEDQVDALGLDPERRAGGEGERQRGGEAFRRVLVRDRQQVEDRIARRPRPAPDARDMLETQRGANPGGVPPPPSGSG